MFEMNAKTILVAVCLLGTLMLAGCADLFSTTDTQAGPINWHTMKIIAGGVGQDTTARVYEEYGMDTSCQATNDYGVGDGWSYSHTYPAPCPDDNGYPHIGSVCPNMKWSVQFRNDHPTDNSEEKYGLPYDARLVNSLQEWRASHQELRFYWVRYSDTQCKFTDNEVIYCVELTSLSLGDSLDHGCIKAMHRTFPGLDTSWRQSLDYASTPVADATSSAGNDGRGGPDNGSPQQGETT